MAGDVTLGDLLRFKGSVGPTYQIQTDTTTIANTLPATEVAGNNKASIIGPDENTLIMNGTLVAAVSTQLPTAAALVAAIPNLYVGQTFKLRIVNASSGAFVRTITTNTGLTLAGTMTISNGTWREFYIACTGIGSNAAFTVTSSGTGTYS